MTFYTRALNYLDTLDIKPDQADDNCKSWKQLKLIFEGENRQAFQTLIDNQSIMPEDMKKPSATLDTTGTTIKSKEHFWAHRDEQFLTLDSNPVRGYVYDPSASLTSSPSAGLPTPKSRRC